MTTGEDLGRVLARLERRVADLEAGQRARQLPDSSIDDGNTRMRDADGQVRGVIGKHTDGTYAVTYANGPAPAAPSPATLVAAEMSLVVFYDGTLADGGPMPADVERVDVHESETAGFTADGSTVRSSLPPEGGARLLVLDNQVHYVKLVAVTTSGVASDASTEVSKTPLAVSDIAAGSIDGMTITGALIRTAASGRRLELSSANSLEAYGSSGDFLGELTLGDYPNSSSDIIALQSSRDPDNVSGVVWLYPGRGIFGAVDGGDAGNAYGSLDISGTSTWLKKQDPARSGDPVGEFYTEDDFTNVTYYGMTAGRKSRFYLDDDTFLGEVTDPSTGDHVAHMKSTIDTGSGTRFTEINHPGLSPDQYLLIWDGHHASFSHDKITYIRVDDGTNNSFIRVQPKWVDLDPAGAEWLRAEHRVNGAPIFWCPVSDVGFSYAPNNGGTMFCEDVDGNARPVSASDHLITSDERRKSDVAPIPTSGLDALRGADPIEYTLDDGVGGKQWGFRASELPAGVVTTDEQGTRDVSVMGTVAVLWQAVRELDQRTNATGGRS